ncbi:hypothetical protein [Paenibacillus agricola]|uniref:hypothetical protein n=1 Tax=Paenibacillus agricola TaxID=2716264 RepID=UPI0035D3F568
MTVELLALVVETSIIAIASGLSVSEIESLKKPSLGGNLPRPARLHTQKIRLIYGKVHRNEAIDETAQLRGIDGHTEFNLFFDVFLLFINIDVE